MTSINRAMFYLFIGLMVVLLNYSSPSNAQIASASTPKEHPLYKSVKDICSQVAEQKKCNEILRPDHNVTMLALATYELGESLIPSLQNRVSKCLLSKGNSEVATNALQRLDCELRHATVGYKAAIAYVRNLKTLDPQTKDVLRQLFPWSTIAARNDRIDLNRSEWEDRSLVTTMKQMEELFYLSYVLTSEIDPKTSNDPQSIH